MVLDLWLRKDINPNPGPETLINTPTNATQLHEMSYSRNELLNLLKTVEIVPEKMKKSSIEILQILVLSKYN